MPTTRGQTTTYRAKDGEVEVRGVYATASTVDRTPYQWKAWAAIEMQVVVAGKLLTLHNRADLFRGPIEQEEETG